MLRRYDFRCTACNYVEEHWTTSPTEDVSCSKCNSPSKRKLSPISTKFEGFGWPGADDKWARDHERAAKTK